jgi:hypothetical protein
MRVEVSDECDVSCEGYTILIWNRQIDAAYCIDWTSRFMAEDHH